MLDAADLPDDIAVLKAMLIAAQAREVRKDDRIERLEKLVAAFKQAAFGRKSEKADPDQFDLALEDLEKAIAAIHAEDDADSPSGKPQPKPRATNRGSLPAHLFRVEEIIEPGSLICGGGLHCIGEDVSERLDSSQRNSASSSRVVPNMPAAPAPTALPHVLVSKYAADHLPLYRQAQIMSRQGVDLDRSTLADWVGQVAFELRPVFDALIAWSAIRRAFSSSTTQHYRRRDNIQLASRLNTLRRLARHPIASHWCL